MSENAADSECAERTTLWTIGHSTRTIAQFQELLVLNAISNLVDVRSYPGSRRYPQFNQAELCRGLRAVGVDYQHLTALGGRRKAQPHSKNTAWQNESFRAYADHMESDDFKQGVSVLLEFARGGRTAVMCAEALWWRCHRCLVADYLKAKGVEVVHILDARHTELHPYTSAARIINGKLSYAGLLPGQV